MSTWEFRKVLALRGPNRWGLRTAHEAWLERTGAEPLEVAGPVRTRVAELTASLAAVGPARDALADLAGVPARCPPGELVARVAATLQAALGEPPPRWQVAALPIDAAEAVVVTYDHEAIGRACLDEALALCRWVTTGEPCDVAARWRDLEARAARARPHVLWRAVRRAAFARDVPWLATPAAGLCQLGWGERQRRLPTDRLAAASADATLLLGDPAATAAMLQSVGAPMLEGDRIGASTHRLLVVAGRVVGCLHAEAAGTGLGWVAGDATVSDDVHALFAAATRMLGLEVAEFWLATSELAEPLDGTTRGITRVSATPDLDGFLAASPGVADAVATALLDDFGHRHGDGRIPVVCVTGTNGKTTTARLAARLLAHAGHRVGLTCTDGIYLMGRRVDTEDCSGPRSARRVLLNPAVDGAVLETARGGILREGMGVDRCDVAIVTNIGAGDHLGLGGVHTAEQIAEVKRTIVTAVGPRGTAVLNANDPLTVAMVAQCPGAVVFFALDGGHPVIRDHRARGGRAVYVADGAVVLADPAGETAVLRLDEIPLTWGGRLGFQVENVLAATAAAWVLGLPHDAMRAALTTFQATFDQAPARFNVFESGGATVLVDYGHNTSSLRAFLPTLDHFPATRRIGVFTATGDRRDVDMLEMGRLLGDAFDEVVIFADRSLRGRDPLQIGDLVGQGVRRGRRARSARVELSFCAAAQQVLDAAQPGDLLVLQADDFNQAVEYLRGPLATRQLRPISLGEVGGRAPPGA